MNLFLHFYLNKCLDKCSDVTARNKGCRKTQLQGFNILWTYSYKASTFPKLFHSTNLHHKRRVKFPTQLRSLWNISSWPLICHVTGLGSYVFIFYVSPLICSKYVCLWSNHHFCLVRKYPCSIPKKPGLLNQRWFRSLLIYTYLYITIIGIKITISFGLLVCAT